MEMMRAIRIIWVPMWWNFQIMSVKSTIAEKVTVKMIQLRCHMKIGYRTKLFMGRVGPEWNTVEVDRNTI